MKRKNRFQLSMIGVLVALFGMFVSCSDDSGGGSTPAPTPNQYAPTAPVLKTPENKAKLSSGEGIKLIWGASTDKDKDPVKYNVYLSEKNKSNLSLLKSEVTSTSYTIGNTLLEGTYQWKIEAIDGKHKTSSEVFSFKVEKVYGVTVSDDNVYLKVGSSKQVNITSGSGNYVVSSNKTNIATADLSGTTINIVAKSEGTAIITVTDTKINQTKQITVNVKNLVISKDRVDLKVGGEESVSIASGSDSYSVSSDKPEVATAEMNGTEIKIIGKSKGTAIITITDNLTEDTKQIDVTVTANTPIIPDGVVIENGILKEWPHDKIPANGHLDIPNTVHTIGRTVFYECSELKSVNVPSSVTSIDYAAFASCSNLTSIKLPEGLKDIGELAFYNCSSLTSLNLPNSLTAIGKGAFRASGLTSIVIPNSVEVLKEDLFNDCTSLVTVRIGNSVKEIKDYAFWNCKKLKNVYFPNSLTTMGNSVFHSCTSLVEIDIPDSVLTMGYDVFNRCGSLKKVRIGKSLRKITSSTFSKCTSLVSIEIPNSVESIGYAAFNECTSLASIKIPSSITVIEKRLFYGCTNLESVVLPNTIKEIQEFAFGNCTGLERIEIPNSVTEIGYGVFQDCSNLESIKLSENIQMLSQNLFFNCESLSSLTIPKSVKRIAGNVINDYPALKVVYSKPVTPPEIEYQSYSGKLVVPKGRRNAYLATPWGQFSPIVEED